MRSNRVRSLLGLNHTSLNDDNAADQAKVNAQPSKPQPPPQQQRRPQPHPAPTSSIVADTEASVLATFEFLNEQRDGTAGRNEGGSGDDDEEVEDDDDDMVDDGDRPTFPIDSETEEVLAEFDFLSSHQNDQKESAWRSGKHCFVWPLRVNY